MGFSILFSPVGIAAVFVAALLSWGSARSKKLRPILIGATLVLASFCDVESEYYTRPTLAFPLETLVQGHQWFTLVFLSALAVAPLLQAAVPLRQLFRMSLPGPAWCLLAVQFAIVLKILAQGSTAFALQAAVVFLLVSWTFYVGVRSWVPTPADLSLCMQAITMGGLFFLTACGWQALHNRSAMFMHNGLFIGMTGNPQHAGILLAVASPAMLFAGTTLVRGGKKWLWVAAAFCCVLLLFHSGSRAGLLVLVVIGTIFVLRRIATPAGKVTVFATAIAVAAFLAQGEAAGHQKMLSVRDTRTQIWQEMWNRFEQFPLFGAPLNAGRLGFGENSWLAIGAGTGLVGLLPMCLFYCLAMCLGWRLLKLSRRNRQAAPLADVLMATLAGLLVGSVFEAYLLGTINFPVYALHVVLVMAVQLETLAMSPPRHRDKVAKVERAAASP